MSNPYAIRSLSGELSRLVIFYTRAKTWHLHRAQLVWASPKSETCQSALNGYRDPRSAEYLHRDVDQFPSLRKNE